MDVLLLSRLQFTATTLFHFLFVPIVLIYQAWAYNLFKGKVKQEDMVY